MSAPLANPHAMTAAGVARQLEIDVERGLTHEEVARRRARYDPNVIPRTKQRSAARILFEQFVNIIVLLLAVAAAISWLTGDRLQALAVVVVLILNALAGFFTEWQAGRALEALRKQMRITAHVRRDGMIVTIAADELTVGDVVLLTSGDRIPADLRVIESAALRTDEAALTGESHSVNKSADAVSAETPLAERTSMLYLGTIVTAGRGVAIVVATGGGTELGRIGRLVSQVETEATPLQRRLDNLGRKLVYIVLVIAAIVAATGWLRGDPLWEMAEVGISLAVAAVPEALPAVTTFILAFGVLRMARRNAIVRRLAAVETLGSTTVICCDKTGTLTLNHMTVIDVRLAEGVKLREAATIAALCNDATESAGDPTEVALVEWAAHSGLDVEELRAENPRIGEEPFDPASKRMITFHPGFAAIKGGPGVVLEMCGVDGEWRKANEEMAARGLRVLALARLWSAAAMPPLSPSEERRHGRRTPELLGLVGMTDPPRVGVPDAIATAHRAGMRVVMLTGDQAATAQAIARELGLDPERDVHARVSPEAKFRIVAELQKSGEIVAVTGDGVNDAPALKKADVGVAMGERGTEVAKEAADIVLADDNFATIVAAIEGGRTIYANIVRFVHMMFSHNLNEVISIFVAIAVGWPLPLVPLQILWLNLVTDVFPAFALALEPGAPDAMDRPPRSPRQPLFSRVLLTTIVWQAAMLAIVTLTLYRWALDRYGAGTHARTIALLALIGVEIGQTLNCRSRVRTAFDGFLRNPWLLIAFATMIGLQAIAFAVPAVRRILDLAVPNVEDGIAFLIAATVPVVVVEVQKWFVRRRLAR